MEWVHLGIVTVLINAASSQSIGCSYAPTTTTIVPTTAPTIVDGNVVQSLIDTIQLFIVSDLLQETLPEKKVFVQTPVESQVLVGYDDCDILPYDFVYDKECPEFVTAMVPKRKCVCKDIGCTKKCECEYVALMPKRCVNFGLNEELILPPYAPELPCGLGYLPGGLPVVAKTFAPCSKCCGCGDCGCPCSAAALPICSPYSCAALAVPLCPEMAPYVTPVIL